MKFTCVLLVVLAVLLALNLRVDGAPFPPPQFRLCQSADRCCPPVSQKPPVPFQFQTGLPWRTRIAAQFADAKYIAKYQRAYQLMKALPNSDPRSLYAQARMHCAYCGAAFYYPRSDYSLEIHDGWFFFPWHRMFLYFHERILASLIGDPTFALPFWNWDNQSQGATQGNVMPRYYSERRWSNKSNPLYDPNRNRCALPPHLIDLNSGGGCSGMPDDYLRTENNRLMYNQMVSGPTTPSLFFGSTYRFGWSGGMGGGTLEGAPHGTVHIFTGNPYSRNPYDDMGNLNVAALDPLFYAHHANIDRLWEVWKGMGGRHKDISDPDYLKSQFVFYDENKRLVSVSVGQVLNAGNLRYGYQKVPNPWMNPKAGGMSTASVDGMDMSGQSVEATQCSALANSDVPALIKSSPLLKKSGNILFTTPLTFRVRRLAPTGNRQEILEINNIEIDWTKKAKINAFLFYPGASGSSIDCMEFFGTFAHIPASNHKKKLGYSRSWRLGLTTKLAQLGKSGFSQVVVTLVQVGSNQHIKFGATKIKLEK
ncbi:polyphenol oxidase, chloroplastic [Physcomitrium patens]|uniref:Tyrosinase copper-binding domain-containing protein n=1 Tax=Physcomitrium patens TaxID=3218 RepID=A9SUP1_PHYPA|nr:polyphenol oxidase, chloroplastic-like [Physcomitrium patens]PNR30692.1 hypothetical protein PHYPA_027008 [Physcomitrium patens]|eukprot:XP_024361473.1 polyphenol oxidase, chloroplastic-like [Physcomitrella patens]